MPRKKKKSLKNGIKRFLNIPIEEKEQKGKFFRSIPKKRRKTSKSNDYLNNSEMFNTLLERKSCKDKERLYEIDQYFCMCCFMLCKKHIRSYNFNIPEIRPYHQEMISEACVKMIEEKSWTKFDPAIGDAVFSYLTKIATNEFIKFIKILTQEYKIKASVLTTLIIQFDVDHCKKGISGKAAFLSEQSKEED